METKDIELGDWERLLIGDNPWGFMIEVLVRSLFIYLCLVVVMRLLGKRMNAQLTITDLAVMLTLGAIASVPMQAFDMGILPGVVLLICILLLHRGLTLLTYKIRKVEVLTQGRVTMVAKDGVIDPVRLRSMRISKEQIFAILRSKGIRHMGQVKRLYSEADGHFSLYKLPETKPGLSVFPGTDGGVHPADLEDFDHLACCNCGRVIEKVDNSPIPCSNCGNKEWIPAVQ